MIEMLRARSGPSIQIATDFEPDVPATRVDPNQLELALLNLALNARDAMPHGGKLHDLGARASGSRRATSRGCAPGDYVCIAERDTGRGMDEATLKRATEPFFTTKGAGHGTGLGLSMVDGLVAQSGGAMRITSQPGIGTTVELWLPASAARRADTRAAGRRPTRIDGAPRLPRARRRRRSRWSPPAPRRCSRISAMSPIEVASGERALQRPRARPRDRSRHHRSRDAAA